MQWGAWGGTGMAIKNNLLPRIIKSGLGVLAPDAGVSALASALSAVPHPAQLVVSPFEWPKLMQGATHVFPIFSEYATHTKPHAPPIIPMIQTPFAPTRPAPMQQGQPMRPLSPLPGKRDVPLHANASASRAVAPHVQAAVAETVAAVVAGVMGKAIDARQPFMEAGLDSLGAVELKTSLEQRLERELPATVVFDYPTRAQLTNFISSFASTAAELPAEVRSGLTPSLKWRVSLVPCLNLM